MTQQQKQFIEQIAGYVKKYAPQFNIKVYSPIIAQAIIESNWGTSDKVINNGVYMHNYFGLKWRENRCPISTGWFTESGSEQDSVTKEYTTSEMKWHKFRSMEECVLGYFQWTNTSKYANLKGVTDPRTYVENIKADNYASSVNYVDTIMNAVIKYDLTKYDEVKEENTMSNEIIVCIDSGHYKDYNKCPTIKEYSEARVMWKLHLLQKKYLEQLGIKVITTRQDQSKDLELITRGKTAKGCVLFISDHTNAVGSYMNESIDYVAVYHLVDDHKVECDDISKEIANKLAPVIAEVMGTKQGYKVLTRKSGKDRNSDGVMNDNYYAVLHGSRLVNVAGLILEHSFHTNTNAVKWLLNDNNLDRLAKAEAECIASYLLHKNVSVGGSSTPTTTPTTPTTSSKVLYRVQAGAYSNQVNAERQLKVVKAKGFTNAILVKSGSLFKIQLGAYSNQENAKVMLAQVKSKGIGAFITTTGGTSVNTSSTTAKKSIENIAKEVIAGKWGNGVARKNRLTQAGYDYYAVQAKVSELLRK